MEAIVEIAGFAVIWGVVQTAAEQFGGETIKNNTLNQGSGRAYFDFVWFLARTKPQLFQQNATHFKNSQEL